MSEYVFHMGEALELFRLLKTDRISRVVINADLGAMGATEVTVWGSKIGAQLEMHHSNGGCSLIVRTEPLHPYNDGLDEYRETKKCCQCGACPGGCVAEAARCGR